MHKVHLETNNGGRFRLPKKAENPFKMGYDPVLNTSPELDSDAASSYLRWLIKLGRIDIITKVSLLLSHGALLGEGHLDATLYVMAHVSQRYNSRPVYGPLCPKIDHCVFKKCD